MPQHTAPSSLLMLSRVALATFAAAALLSGCSNPSEDACSSDAECAATQSCNDEGECVTATIPMVPVRLSSFDADTGSVERGRPVTLTWSTRFATSGNLRGSDGFLELLTEDRLDEGSVTVTPSADVTYTLLVGNDTGDASEQVSVEVTEPPVLLEPPRISTFDVDPPSVLPGQSATLSWRLRLADEATITAGDAAIAELTGAQLERGSLEITPGQTTTYELRATNADGAISERVTLDVALTAPVIRDFSSSVDAAPIGAPVTLSWEVEDAAELSLESLGGEVVDLTGTDPRAGSVEVTLDRSISYVLEASSAGGTARATTMIEALAPLAITRFDATPDLIDAGQTASLVWNIDRGVAALALTDDQGNAFDTSGANQSSGSLPVSPTVTTTYTLDVTSLDGQTASATATIGIRPPAPTITRFVATPDEVAPGATSSLTWEATDAESITIVDDQGAMIDLTGLAPDADTVDVTVAQDATYTLAVTNSTATTTATASVLTGAPVTSTLGASAAMVADGDPVTLSWTASGADGPATITSSDGAPVDLVDPLATSGSVEVTPRDASTTYTLEVPGFGGPAISTVTVAVDKVVFISEFRASPALVPRGQPTTLTWRVFDAQSVALDATDSQGSRAIPTQIMAGQGSVADPVIETTTYTLSASDLSSTLTAQVVVDVYDPAVIDSFAFSPDPVPANRKVTLSWQTSFATTVTLVDAITQQPIPYTDLGNGAGEVEVRPMTTTSYQLRVQGAEGSSEARTVTVPIP